MVHIQSKRWWKAALCAALLLALAVAGSAECLTVRTTENRIYTRRNTHGASRRLRQGQTLRLTGLSGGWARVTSAERSGFIPLKHLDLGLSRVVYAARNTWFHHSPAEGAARRRIGVNAKLFVLGRSGEYLCVVSAGGGQMGYMRAEDVSRRRVNPVPWRRKVELANWFEGGEDVLPKDGYGVLYHIATGTTLRIKRMGGHNHADVEPATAEDTEKLRALNGGSFGWESHACILYSGGRYVACAINTKPHGQQTLKNNGYNGQFCLHMVGSITHGSHRVNEHHQAAIAAAYAWSRR